MWEENAGGEKTYIALAVDGVNGHTQYCIVVIVLLKAALHEQRV